MSLTEENIGCVFNNLSEISRNDAKVLNISINEMKSRYLKSIGKPFTFAFYTDNFECCALLVAELIDSLRWRVYFVDVKGKLKKISIPLTRFLKGFSDYIVKKDGGCFEMLSVFGPGTKTAKWFSVMGFKYVGIENKKNKYEKVR